MKSHARQPIRQYEFPFTEHTFNLFAETAEDGERISREHEAAAENRALAEAAQTPLFPPHVAHLRRTSPYRLRAGDLIQYEGQECPVIHVSDCAAVVAMEQAPREFSTIFGKRVCIQPKPRLVRISSNSLVPILNRAA